MISPTNGFSAVGTPAGTFNVSSEIFYLTNAGASSLNWSLANTSSWLSVSSVGGTLVGGTNDSVVVSLNDVASNLTAGAYSATIWFSNVTSGITFSRHFTLTTADHLVILPTNSFSFFGLDNGQFIPAAQSITLTNPGSGTLGWGINNTSSWFSVSSLNGSLSPGGQTAVAINLTSDATNLPDGIYAAALQVTNLTSQFVQVVTGSVLVGQPLVQNGGFETGDFTDWTLAGDAGNYDLVDNSGVYVASHSGSYVALLGEVNTQAYLSQTLPTVPGQKYLLSLWLENSLAGSHSNPNEFSVSWNGSALYDKKNIGVINWTNMLFVVTASNSSTVLKIGGRNDNDYLGLDDVSVVPAVAPGISTQPTNLTILSGQNATFSVTASGTAPLVYQWRENGTNISNGGNISGATANALTLTAATASNIGNYSVVITNMFGATTSSVASLTVISSPVITNTFPSYAVECGSNDVTYTAIATGTPPLDYQWSLDGVPVPGATNTSFLLTNVHLPNHVIAVTVTNLYGSVTSNAVLTVQDTLAPVITLNGGNPIYVELGGAFTDPGATANDACAGALRSCVSGIGQHQCRRHEHADLHRGRRQRQHQHGHTRTVIVRDTTPPTISWSFTNLVLAADTNCSALMPDVTGTNFILATDLSGAVTNSQSPTNGAILPLGTNTVVITVQDASGNAAYSTNQIIVQDQTPPVILSPAAKPDQ